jgi:hypothetical protein
MMPLYPVGDQDPPLISAAARVAVLKRIRTASPDPSIEDRQAALMKAAPSLRVGIGIPTVVRDAVLEVGHAAGIL